MRGRRAPETIAPNQAVAADVVGEVIKAYYPAVLKSADAARQRAQNAYAIASAIAAALVAAGIFGEIGDAEALTQGVAFVSLLGWLVTAALFMYAVAGSVEPKIDGEQSDGSAFVRAAMTNARDEREKVSRRLDTAQVVTVVSVGATIVAIGLVLFNEPDSAAEEARVALTSAGSVAVAPVCGIRVRFVDGYLDPSNLAHDYVALKVQSGPCGAGTTLAIRTKDISSVAFK